MKRNATIVWKGSGKDGSGTITTESKTLNNAHYAWNSRFENSQGTNPEELLAAAHGGCFTMKLSFLLAAQRATPDYIETTVEITLEKDSISHSHLIVKAKVPGINNEIFQECAETAREGCLVSKAFNMEITMEAELVA